MKLCLNKYFIIPLLSIFFPALAIVFKNIYIFVFFIILPVFYLLFLLCAKTKFIKDILILYKTTSFKYFVWFCLWILVSGFILCIGAKYSFSRFAYYTIFYLLFNIVLVLCFPYFLIKRFCSLEFLIKFYIGICFFIFVVGFIDFIGNYCNIKLLSNFVQILANYRGLHTNSLFLVKQSVRVSSVFQEPGWLAGFITINLPIFYTLIKNDYKLFKNKYLNITIKKLLLPFAILNLILTQSPIWLLFSVFITLFFFRKKILIFLYKKKYSIITLIILFVIFLSVFSNKINLEKTYLSRISPFITLVKTLNYDTFALIEPSLASRINSYYNSFKLFCDNFMLGVGLGNSKFYLNSYFETSPLTLTEENLRCLYASYSTGKLAFNSSIVWEYLSELGLIGFLCFYYFIYKLVKSLKNVRNLSFLELIFQKGLRFSIMAVALLSFYDLCSAFIYIWFLIGMGLAFSYKTSNKILLGDNKREL